MVPPTKAGVAVSTEPYLYVAQPRPQVDCLAEGRHGHGGEEPPRGYVDGHRPDVFAIAGEEQLTRPNAQGEGVFTLTLNGVKLDPTPDLITDVGPRAEGGPDLGTPEQQAVPGAEGKRLFGSAGHVVQAERSANDTKGYGEVRSTFFGDFQFKVIAFSAERRK